MKSNIFFTILICLLAGFGLRAQSTAHPTIDSVKVRYKSVPQSTVASISGFIVIPEASVKLKDTLNISKVYLKICRVASDSVLYQVQYNFNDSVTTNSAGKKLFERKGNRVFVSPGTTMPLKLYKYKLQTADTLQSVSTTFTITQ